MTRKNLSGQRRVTPILPMLPEAEGWRRAGRPVEPGRLQASLRGCNAEAPRCNRAGDTTWAPRCSAGRTAESAGPRRRNAQLRWAMRGQDPLKEQRVPGSAGLLADRTRCTMIGRSMRIVAHIDMDAFYAAIEERDTPRFRGLPIAVGADPEGGKGRGVVAAANYKARAYGIHSAMPISTAWRLSEAARRQDK